MKLTIVHPVEHDGKRLEPGAEVDLPNAAAQALVACGAAEPAGKARAKAEAEAKAKAEAEAAAGSPAAGQAEPGADVTTDGEQG